MQPGREANNRQINQPAVHVIANFTGVTAGRKAFGICGGVSFDQRVFTGIRTCPLFGRHLDSRPFGLGGKVFYLLCLSSILSNSSVMQLLYTKTMRTYLWLLPRPNWESIGPHCINGKKEFGAGKKTRMAEAKTQQKQKHMQKP